MDRFVTLFTGSQLAYGQWAIDQTPNASTKMGAPTPKHYQNHLDGKIGLGIIPVNGEGMCKFAAIDVDVDTIDHQNLLKDVKKHGLPLNVCRSKSGGAHLYLFAKDGGLPADSVRGVLQAWATLLGYGNSEIFPKQKRSSPDNLGNWINLPYFAGDATLRYCVNEDGAMGLEEFLDSVRYFDPNEVIVQAKTQAYDAVMPPCLQMMKEQGVTAGYRNQALLNYAIFFRKSSPEDWDKKTKLQNSQYFSPPLDSREVGGVIQSAGRTKYQYTCDNEPLRGFCNKPVCVTLPFGVGHMPWQEGGGLDDLSITNCRKLLTDPPKYIVNVNSKDITLDWESFYTFAKFKSKIGEVLNVVVANRKQVSWEQTVRGLLTARVDIEAPDDASTIGLVIQKLHEFLGLRERAINKEDILRGLPIQDGDDVLFRASDFKHYLQGFRLDKIEGSDLFLALRSQGSTHRRIRIAGKLTMVWVYPLKRIDEQSEAFTVPNFEKDFGDEV